MAHAIDIYGKWLKNGITPSRGGFGGEQRHVLTPRQMKIKQNQSNIFTEIVTDSKPAFPQNRKLN